MLSFLLTFQGEVAVPEFPNNYSFVAERDKMYLQFVAETNSRLQNLNFEARVHKAI